MNAEIPTKFYKRGRHDDTHRLINQGKSSYTRLLDRLHYGGHREKIVLKDEYLHIHRVIQDFDGRAVTIKGWSVTFSLVALVGAFVSHAPVALLVGSSSACLFWLIEGFWKAVQYAYYDRAGKIERYFAGEIKDLIPLQVGASWYKKWKSSGIRRLIRLCFDLMLPCLIF